MAGGGADVTSPFDSPTFGKDGQFEVDKPVGSMSISPCGRDVVLASRHGLHIIDLDSPWAPPRHLAHHTPWEVADVQWSPFPARDHWVVSTSNQKALVWNLEVSSRYNPIEYTLHGHSRALTDIQFSAHDPNTLATCAVDAFVHCWDLRTPERPAYSFCDWFAGATQTKWNRISPHIIASSHDRTLHVWDNRKGAYPLRSLDAHDTKIYGIDWNRTDPHKILTCSLDKSVKFWDYSAEVDRPERLLRTPFPVWRARHTPFGHGIMAMPQRDNFDLHLYDTREESIWDLDLDRAPQLVQKFTGHQSNIKEFLWRPRGLWQEGCDNREFQLVTWGADQHLRLHHLSDAQLQLVGFEKGRPGNFTTRKNAPYRTYRVDDSALVDRARHPNDQAGAENDAALSARVGAVSTSPNGGPLGWADTGFFNTQPGIRAKAPPRKDIDPIAWMKGVKIGKQELKGKQPNGPTMIPTLNVDTWEEFDSLGEEVKHVGQTFSKIEFGGVDINKRYLTMSLYGPWGKERAPVFMSCKLIFPNKYPAEAAEISLQESSAISPENMGTLKETAGKIATEFAKRNKASIEAIVRFLHGERTLDDLTDWLKQALSTPNMLPRIPDDESSSDEEEGLGQLAGAQFNELGLSSSDVLVNSNANANVPTRRECGAVWTRDGRLICFFRQRIQGISTATGLFGMEHQSGSFHKKARYFDGFGRVKSAQTSALSAVSSGQSFDSDDSAAESESDESSALSTDESSVIDSLSDKQYTTSHSAMRNSVGTLAPDPRSNDGIPGSESSKKPLISYFQDTKSIVSIRDLSRLIPARRELAAYQYQGRDQGKENTALALLHDSSDLADAWTMATSLCQWQEATNLSGRIAANLQLKTAQAEIASEQAGRKSWDILSTTLSDNSASVRLSIALRLSTYFEVRADVQTAASLACAFQSLITPHSLQGEIKDKTKPRGFNRRLSESHQPRMGQITTGSPNFIQTEPQYASDPARPLRTDSDELLLQSASLGSSLGAYDNGRRSSLPAGTSPPSRRIPKAHTLRNQSSFSHLKPSPTSRLWQLESAAGGIIAGAGNFANAISQNFSFSASASPPLKKWSSPSMSFTTAKSHLTRESRAATVSSQLLTGRNGSLSDGIVQHDVKDAHTDRPKRRRLKVEYVREGPKASQTFPFLTPAEQESLSILFDMQRCAYADFLTAWGMPVARAEVLKHNTLPGNERNTAEQPAEKTPLQLGRLSSETSSAKKGPPPGLLARRLCPFCQTTNWLDRRNSAFRCLSCTRRVPPLACVFCNKTMRGRTYPCFSCGHVLHARCRSKLATESGLDVDRCVEGCDCACPSAVVVTVPSLSEAESSAHQRKGSAETQNTQTTEIKLEVTRAEDGEVINDEMRPGHGQAWEDMAKESLVRNLELRKVRATGDMRRVQSGIDVRTAADPKDRLYRPRNMHQKRRGPSMSGALEDFRDMPMAGQ